MMCDRSCLTGGKHTIEGMIFIRGPSISIVCIQRRTDPGRRLIPLLVRPILVISQEREGPFRFQRFGSKRFFLGGVARPGYAVHAYVRSYGTYPPWREPREVSRPKSVVSDVLMLDIPCGILYTQGKASF